MKVSDIPFISVLALFLIRSVELVLAILVTDIEEELVTKYNLLYSILIIIMLLSYSPILIVSGVVFDA